MSKNQKILLVILSLYVVADFVIGTLTNLYLWNDSASTRLVLEYNAWVFITMLGISQLSVYVVKYLGIKTTYALAMVFSLIQLIMLVVYGENISSLVFLLGILSGVGIGLQSYCYTVLATNLNNQKAEYFFGTKMASMNLMRLTMVPLITFLISLSGSYFGGFGIGILFLLMIMALIYLLKVQIDSDQVKPLDGWLLIKEFPDVRKYVTSRFLYGIFNGLFWVVLGITLYQLIENVFWWGIALTLITLLSVIGSYLYGKYSKPQYDQYVATIVAFLFASATLILAVYWSLTTLLLYQLALLLMNIVLSTDFEVFLLTIAKENETIKKSQQGLISVGELFLNLGRLLPILILIFVGFSFTNTLMLRILFACVSIIPLYMMVTLKDTRPFKDTYDILNIMKIYLEVFLTKIEGDLVVYKPVIIDITDKTENPDETVLQCVQDNAVTHEAFAQHKIVSHSTSWHYDVDGSCKLTYVVYSDLLAMDEGNSKILKVKDIDVAVSQDLTHPRPKELNEKQVISHGLRHISHLVKENSSAYKEVLSESTMATLLDIQAELAGNQYIARQLQGLG